MNCNADNDGKDATPTYHIERQQEALDEKCKKILSCVKSKKSASEKANRICEALDSCGVHCCTSMFPYMYELHKLDIECRKLFCINNEHLKVKYEREKHKYYFIFCPLCDKWSYP